MFNVEQHEPAQTYFPVRKTTLYRIHTIIKMFTQYFNIWFILFSLKADVRPDPLLSYLKPESNFGVISENLEQMLGRHCKNSSVNSKKFKNAVYYKAMRALSAPGDAVGVLAAQVN